MEHVDQTGGTKECGAARAAQGVEVLGSCAEVDGTTSQQSAGRRQRGRNKGSLTLVRR